VQLIFGGAVEVFESAGRSPPCIASKLGAHGLFIQPPSTSS